MVTLKTNDDEDLKDNVIQEIVEEDRTIPPPEKRFFLQPLSLFQLLFLLMQHRQLFMLIQVFPKVIRPYKMLFTIGYLHRFASFHDLINVLLGKSYGYDNQALLEYD